MGIHLFRQREQHRTGAPANGAASTATRGSAATTKAERKEARAQQRDEVDHDRRAETRQATRDARFAKKFPAAGGQLPAELQTDAPPAVKAALVANGLPTATTQIVALVPQPLAPHPLTAATPEALATAKAEVTTALATLEKQKTELTKLGAALENVPPRSADPSRREQKLEDRLGALKLFVTTQTDRADKAIEDLTARLAALEGGEALLTVVEARVGQRETLTQLSEPVVAATPEEELVALTTRIEELDGLKEQITVTTEQLEDPTRLGDHTEAFAEVHEELVTLSHALDDAPALPEKLDAASESFLSRAAELVGKPVLERAAVRKTTTETATATLAQTPKPLSAADRRTLETTRDALKRAIAEGEIDLDEAEAILARTGPFSVRDRIARKWAQQVVDGGAREELEAAKDTLAEVNGALVVIPTTIRQRIVAPAVPVLDKDGEPVLGRDGQPVLLQPRPTLDTRWPSAWYESQLETAKRLGVDPYFWIAALTLELPGGYTDTSFRIKPDNINTWSYGFTHDKLSRLFAAEGIAETSDTGKLARYELCRYYNDTSSAQQVLDGPPPFDPNTVSSPDYVKAIELMEQASTASGKEFVEYGGAASGCVIGDAAFSAGVLDDLQPQIRAVAARYGVATRDLVDEHGAPAKGRNGLPMVDRRGKPLQYIEPSDNLAASYEQSFLFLLAQQQMILPRFDRGEGVASSLQRFNGPGSIDYRVLGGGSTYAADIKTSPAYGATMMAMIYAMQDPRNEGYAEIRALVESVYGEDPAGYPITSRVAAGMKDDPYARWFGEDLATLGTAAYAPIDRGAEQP